ncbi:MAG: 16S rRNA (uracil(1498)-N(3))-methyltransferase [Thermodesulfovibrionales bacterium]|nr:16S rRNA (uracil(1498)-N(3))-methyltransferase [Thermodesulfovibrionales bacterium]
MRIILPKEQIKGQRITISGEKARYLISVLRCNAGDELQVFDGEGSFYKSRISGIDNKEVKIDLLEKIPFDTESPLNLILIQGILKGDKMDWVIQKATELGVKEIIPAITERGQIRETRKAARWRKIAEEASRQSGRSMVPAVREPVEFSSLLMADSSMALRGFIFWEEGGIRMQDAIKQLQGAERRAPGIDKENPGPMPYALCPMLVVVGPEGGFTKEEVRLAESRGLIATSLGKRILRAETAAISAVTLVQFLMGDIAGCPASGG